VINYGLDCFINFVLAYFHIRTYIIW